MRGRRQKLKRFFHRVPALLTSYSDSCFHFSSAFSWIETNIQWRCFSLNYWYRCYGYRLQVMYCFVLFYKRLTVVAVSDKPKSNKNKRYFYSDGVKNFLSVIFHELLLYAFYTDRRSLLIHNIWPIKSLFLF